MPRLTSFKLRPAFNDSSDSRDAKSTLECLERAVGTPDPIEVGERHARESPRVLRDLPAVLFRRGHLVHDELLGRAIGEP